MLSDTRLRYLFEAARLGTMRAASDKLGVATSSVSRQIAELEKELGIALLERGRRRITLTEAGEAACQYYRDKTAQEEVFLARIDDFRSVRTGRVDLAVGEAFITDDFSAVLQSFMQEHPGIKVRVHMRGTNDSIALVRDDEVHFGLAFDLPRDPKVRARLSLRQPLLVVTHPRHELARRRRLSLADLRGQSVGLPEESFRIRQVVHVAEQAENIFIEPALTTNSMTLLKDFAKCGRGVTLLPSFLAEPELSAGGLVAIPTSNAILNNTHCSLITRVGRQLPLGAYRLMQDVTAYLKRAIPDAGAKP